MKKLYIVKTAKIIPGLGGIVGPLLTPTVMAYSNVLDMVSKGYEIYQVNPYDLNEKILVTKTNINSIKFKRTMSECVNSRKLNRSIQEMESASKVDVVRKEGKTESEKPDKKFTNDKAVATEKTHKKEKSKESTSDTTIKDNTTNNKNTEIKVTTPDAFTK